LIIVNLQNKDKNYSLISNVVKNRSQINYKISEVKKEIDLQEIKNFVNKREETREILSINILLKIKAFICPKKLNILERFYIKLYHKAIKIINYNMDMVNYLKFIQEYDLMKNLLFNDFQSVCFSFMRKPKIYEKISIPKMNYHLYKELKEIIIYLKENRFSGELDHKIYDLLSDDVKYFISHTAL